MKEKEQKLFLDGWPNGTFLPMSETSFYQMDDENTEIHLEKPNEDGNYTRLRVIQPFFWFTAERRESEGLVVR